jgi:hypothetical protein
MIKFTPEELEELRRADAELDENFVQTQKEIEASRKRDRAALTDRLDNKGRKISEYQAAYREANRDKIAAQKAAWQKKNREKWNAYLRAYRAKKKAAACYHSD